MFTLIVLFVSVFISTELFLFVGFLCLPYFGHFSFPYHLPSSGNDYFWRGHFFTLPKSFMSVTVVRKRKSSNTGNHKLPASQTVFSAVATSAQHLRRLQTISIAHRHALWHHRPAAKTGRSHFIIAQAELREPRATKKRPPHCSDHAARLPRADVSP